MSEFIKVTVYDTTQYQKFINVSHIISFEPNQYFYCDKHKTTIQVLGDNIPVMDTFEEVINKIRNA